MKLTVQQLRQITNAIFKGPEDKLPLQLSIPLTDSRSLTNPEETVFFAIRTAAGDGHNFIDALYTRGVRVFVTDRHVELPDDAVTLQCADTLVALQQTAAFIRSLLLCPIIGITGSVAKTIVKEKLNSSLLNNFRIARSPRSWNSQVGLPLSIWQANKETQLGIFEAGVSATNEMQHQAKILRPTIGILTPITAEHDHGFASRQDKIREKAILFLSCSTVFSLADDEATAILQQLYPNKEIVATKDIEDVCRKVAEYLDIDNINFDSQPLSTRIDITETPVGLTVALDRFTCDLQSLATGLDVMRRRIPDGAALTVVLGAIQFAAMQEDKVFAQLEELLNTYGVTRLITADPVTARHAKKFTLPLRVTTFVSPEELIAKLNVYDFYNTVVYVNSSNKTSIESVYTWLSRHRNVTRMEINLDSLARNFNHYRALLPSHTGLIGMVKAGAYGCGAMEVARTLQSHGADMVAVAVVDEGVELRHGGVTLPIMVLDPWCDNLGAIFANGLEPTLIDASEETLLSLEKAADSQGVDLINVHLKLDTGMHRVGLRETEIDAFTDLLKQHPRIRIASIFSHLATADCLGLDSYTNMQLSAFERMSSKIISHLGYPVKRHILNTAGISRFGHDSRYDLARLGIGLYGISPLDANDGANLLPVARLVTRVIATRRCEPGDAVGYGCKGRISRPTLIGTIPVGYADGIDRRMGNGNVSFLINGVMCPTVGNICMDLCMVDITDVPGADSGVPMEVEIFGPQAPIERLSDTLGTIPYEILARISPRVKRVYFRE